jgi:hypothetical protein
VACSVPPAAFFEFESETVDPEALRRMLFVLLEKKDTKELQQALRMIKALFVGK